MRALLSVYDKRGMVELAHELVALGSEIVATDGTRRALGAAGVPVLAVAEVTDFPEILDGRVKTLHPRIHGGLLARRDLPAHVATLREHGIVPIDLVVANLYPFAATVRNPATTLEDATEQIDIGGPAMIRAAAKNFRDVVVLTDPADYEATLAAFRTSGVALALRRSLAAKAFAHVAAYDAVVAEYLRDDPVSINGASRFPVDFSVTGRKIGDLRYGENPQQRAAAYRRVNAGPAVRGVLDATQRAGKDLSFNNLLDADAAWNAVRSVTRPTAVIVKHTIPCGLATRDRIADAFGAALAGDPVSAFGGIVALNRGVDGETAPALAEHFFEVVIAPSFTIEARAVLGGKKQLRLLAMGGDETTVESGVVAPWDIRPIRGGLLIQDADESDESPPWHVVTDREPTPAEWDDLRYAWAAVRLVKSNGITIAKDETLVGVGSGQPNRVDSVAIAVRKAADRAVGAALASDAFFPFPDGVEVAAAAGVTAIVQPGGSVRDASVIAAADRAGVAMVFSGIRHFRH